jgi:hypothetical protein
MNYIIFILGILTLLTVLITHSSVNKNNKKLDKNKQSEVNNENIIICITKTIENCELNPDNYNDRISDLNDGKIKTVFVSTTNIRNFYDQHIKNLPSYIRIHLVTGTGDESPNFFEDILQDHRIEKWFAINIKYIDFENKYVQEKVRYLPLGVDFHTLTKMSYWHTPESSLEEQNKTLLSYYKKDILYKYKAFADFHLHITNEERTKARDQLINKECVIFLQKQAPRSELWHIWSKYQFVISPTGNGPDCHRTWEILSICRIPIVKTTTLDPLYRPFPVVIIKEWTDITEANMKKWSSQIHIDPNYLHSILFSDFWKQVMNDVSALDSLPTLCLFHV